MTIIPFEISANGVYRCVKYLNAVTFYVEENGWTEETPELKKKYTYKAIRQYLIETQAPLFRNRNNCYDVYDGDYLWEHFFLADPFLADRIKHMGITSLPQLQFYANKAANWE